MSQGGEQLAEVARRPHTSNGSQPKRSFGACTAVDTVASSELAQVKLTKFAALPAHVEPHFVLNLAAPSPRNSIVPEAAPSDSSSEGGLQMASDHHHQIKQRQHQDSNIKSLSANDLLRQADELSKVRKWPWLAAASKAAAASSPLQVDISNNSNNNNASSLDLSKQLTPAAQANASEPFQVVWRRLTFEVQPSSYDRLVASFLGGLRSFWRKPPMEEPAKSPQSGERRRVIFENLNGHISSGEISAILGPSGSGKTSLLNAICGRVDNYRGSVQLLGGGKRRMRLSIIPQKDYLIENLTVRENLLYSSKILNANKSFDHERNILRVVKMLNLTNCLESSAGNISGGEYKRVSIAQELLRQPDILILDEPTSGLDSLNCKNLIKSLGQLIEASRRGAINPIAIVMTIHQPDIDTFQMFDHVYCIARRGQVVFDGHPSEALNVVRQQAGLPERLLPKSGSMGVNPANLLIELASNTLYGEEPIKRLADYQRSQFEINQAYSFHSSPNNQNQNKSEDNLLASAAINKGYLLSPNASPKSNASFRSNKSAFSNQFRCNSSQKDNKDGASQLVRDKRLNAKNDISGKFWYHTNLLARRAFTSTIRDPMMTILSLLFHLSIPFVMWVVYPKETGSVKACPVIHREMEVISMMSNRTMDRMEQMQEDFNLALECSTMFFLSTYSFSMCSLSIAALAFPLNMHILLKEVRNGWYSLPSYVLAKTLANIPFEVLYPVMSIIMIYVMLGMPSSDMEWRLWAMALVMALISMISHTQGLVFGALCMDSVQTAIFLASASSLPLTLLSGFTARIKHMPVLLQKLSWLSLYRYSSDSINIIRFGFGICPCDSSTEWYLRNNKPEFTDVPQNMRPLFAYYLTSGTSAPTELDNVTTTTIASTVANTTSHALVEPQTVVANLTNKLAEVPGISYDFILEPTARSQMLKRIEANEIDMFGRMATLMSRSFTYGMEVENCTAFRSQLLISAGAPKDEFLPMLFAGMVGLLVAAKVILFVIVKLKIGSRV